MILVTFAGVLAIAIFAVVAFLLTDTPNLRCVEGELQNNTLAADGSFQPRVESFATLDEAEAFICRALPYPRQTHGLDLTGVVVTRATNLGTLIEGEGSAIVAMAYAPDAGAPPRLTLAVTFPAQSAPEATGGERLTVQGQRGTLARGPDDVYVTWDKNDFRFVAQAKLDSGFSLEDVLAILESVR